MSTPDRSHDRPTDAELERLLAAAASAPDAPRFDAGFADRVMARVAAEREEGDALPFDLQLWRQFWRVVPVAAAASLLLGALNWWSARDSGAPPLVSAAGLPAVTLATALSSVAPLDGGAR